MRKLFFCVLISICITALAHSQNIQQIYYTYDAVGNRTGRVIVTEEESGANKAARNNNSDEDNESEDEVVPDDIIADVALQTVPAQNYEAKIYPNPTADILNIKVSESASLRYILHNGNGVQLLSGSFTAETTLQISGYARGVYYLSIYGNNDSGNNNGSKNNSNKSATGNSSDRRVWKIIKQ